MVRSGPARPSPTTSGGSKAWSSGPDSGALCVRESRRRAGLHPSPGAHPTRGHDGLPDDDRSTSTFKRIARTTCGYRRIRIARPSSDTCHALASDGPVVRERWPEYYTGVTADAGVPRFATRRGRCTHPHPSERANRVPGAQHHRASLRSRRRGPSGRPHAVLRPSRATPCRERVARVGGTKTPRLDRIRASRTHPCRS